jgi:RND family efflux transporter MFP subunit
MKSALASLPRAHQETVAEDGNGDEMPDLVAISPEPRVASGTGRTIGWLIATVVVLGVAAGVWHWYPQIVGLVGGKSSAGAGANAQGSGKAPLGFAAGKANGAAKSGGARLQTVPVELKRRPDVLKLTGTLMADERSSVASNTSGIAAEVCVDRGDVVKKGDLLVRIDPRDAQNKLTEGQAMVDELKARLGLDQCRMEDFKPEEEPEVRLAKASADLAAANLARAKENIAKGVISKEAFDQFRTEEELATQRYRQSLFLIRQAFQVCKTAQVKLAILQKAFDDTVIRAPFDGWVAEKLVAPGEQISSGMQATKVVTLVRVDPLRLSLTVAQQDIGRIRQGQTVRFRVDSFPDRVFDAQVRFIAPVVTNDTRTMVVEALVRNPDHLLHPGVFATAELELPRQGSTVFAPLGAVLRTGEVGRVFVVRDGVAREQIVALGDTEKDTIEILSGLTGKEVLVVNPEKAHDGEAVE